MGAPRGLHWTDADVVREESGRPRIEISGTIAAHARELGVTHLHLALTHDGGFACAVVVAEGS